MKRILSVLLLLCYLTFSVLLVPVFAEEAGDPDLAADAAKAEKQPPTIPHAIQDDADGTSCNNCHTGGFKAPHPERLNCTQCHVPGAVKPPVKKSTKKAPKK